MSDLKPCPYRVYGAKVMSLTVAGEFVYSESFMPCMQDGCPCFHLYCGDAYCDRNGAYMRLCRIETEDSECEKN